MLKRLLIPTVLAGLLLAVAGPSAACAENLIVSVDQEGRGADGDSDSASLSADGTVVAFSSDAGDLVPGDRRLPGPTCEDRDARRGTDVFVRDLRTHATVRVSANMEGASANGDSGSHSISADGTLVAFSSLASDLVPDDGNGARDVFVHYMPTGETRLVSRTASHNSGNGASFSPAVSGDGSAVVFESQATDLVDGVPPRDREWNEVFHRDLDSGATTWVSAAHGGGVPDAPSGDSSTSADGRVVVFHSGAENLTAAGAQERGLGIFRRDLDSGQTIELSAGVPDPATSDADVNAEGDTVAFATSAALDPDDGNEQEDVYVIDLADGRPERISVDTVGGNANDSSSEPSISDDGRRVAFISNATDLVNGDRGPGEEGSYGDDVFIRDRDRARTEQLNVTAQAADADGGTFVAELSGNGRVVGFSSYANDLVIEDAHPGQDVFVTDVEVSLTDQRPPPVEEPAPILRLRPPERTAVDLALAWSRERDLGEPNYGSRRVLLARDDDPADAIASGGVQGRDDINPLLLTPPDHLDQDVATELVRLGVDHVTVLGGEQAVSDSVLMELQEKGYEVGRAFGPTRVETAIRLDTYPSSRPREGNSHALLVRAYGTSADPTSAFADSIAAGRYAALVELPILLTPSDHLPAALEEHLRGRVERTGISLERVTVIGGPDAVSETVVAQVRALGLEVERLAGADRAGTAVEVARRLMYTDHINDASDASVVHGWDPLAWASGFAAAAEVPNASRGPLLVVGDDVPAATQEWFEGGDGDTPLVCGPLVSDRVCDEVARLGGQLPSDK